MKKQLYEQPTTKTLVVRFESIILNGSSFGTAGYAGSTLDQDDVIELY